MVALSPSVSKRTDQLGQPAPCPSLSQLPSMRRGPMHDSCCGDNTHATNTATGTADSVLSDVAPATASAARSMHPHPDALLPSTRGSFKLPRSSYGGSQGSERWWARRLHLSQQHLHQQLEADGSHGYASGVEIPTHGQHQLQQKSLPEGQPCVRSMRSMSCAGQAMGTHVVGYLQRSDAAPTGPETTTPDSDLVSWSGGPVFPLPPLPQNDSASPFPSPTPTQPAPAPANAPLRPQPLAGATTAQTGTPSPAAPAPITPPLLPRPPAVPKASNMMTSPPPNNPGQAPTRWAWSLDLSTAPRQTASAGSFIAAFNNVSAGNVGVSESSDDNPGEMPVVTSDEACDGPADMAVNMAASAGTAAPHPPGGGVAAAASHTTPTGMPPATDGGSLAALPAAAATATTVITADTATATATSTTAVTATAAAATASPTADTADTVATDTDDGMPKMSNASIPPPNPQGHSFTNPCPQASPTPHPTPTPPARLTVTASGRAHLPPRPQAAHPRRRTRQRAWTPDGSVNTEGVPHTVHEAWGDAASGPNPVLEEALAPSRPLAQPAATPAASSSSCAADAADAAPPYSVAAARLRRAASLQGVHLAHLVSQPPPAAGDPHPNALPPQPPTPSRLSEPNVLPPPAMLTPLCKACRGSPSPAGSGHDASFPAASPHPHPDPLAPDWAAVPRPSSAFDTAAKMFSKWLCSRSTRSGGPSLLDSPFPLSPPPPPPPHSFSPLFSFLEAAKSDPSKDPERECDHSDPDSPLFSSPPSFSQGLPSHTGSESEADVGRSAVSGVEGDCGDDTPPPSTISISTEHWQPILPLTGSLKTSVLGVVGVVCGRSEVDTMRVTHTSSTAASTSLTSLPDFTFPQLSHHPLPPRPPSDSSPSKPNPSQSAPEAPHSPWSDPGVPLSPVRHAARGAASHKGGTGGRALNGQRPLSALIYQGRGSARCDSGCYGGRGVMAPTAVRTARPCRPRAASIPYPCAGPETDTAAGISGHGCDMLPPPQLRRLSAPPATSKWRDIDNVLAPSIPATLCDTPQPLGVTRPSPAQGGHSQGSLGGGCGSGGCHVTAAGRGVDPTAVGREERRGGGRLRDLRVLRHRVEHSAGGGTGTLQAAEN